MSAITDAIGFVIGTILASVIDIAVFCAIAAIPLAALVYLSLIIRGTAMAILLIVAVILTLRVIIVASLRQL